MHDPIIGGTAGSTQQQDMPPDQYDLETARGRAKEAAERVSFHQCEVERWTRIGHAAVMAAERLQTVEPVGETSPDQWSSPAKATPVSQF